MTSDGEDFDEGSDASFESHMARFIEWKGGKAVAFNVTLVDMSDHVCIDSGTNKLILISADQIENYRLEDDTFLMTAEEGGKVKVKGRGSVGLCEDILHCPGVSANLMSTDITFVAV